MDFVELMNVYFRGEKLEAFLFITPAGVILLILGIVALYVEKGGFAWGVAIPAFLFGLILLGTGLSVGLRTHSQVTQITQSYKENPANMVQTELPRMQKVNALFVTTYKIFGALVIVALILIFAVATGWSRGLGAMLVLAAGIGLMVDGFASRRALPYTHALEQINNQN